MARQSRDTMCRHHGLSALEAVHGVLKGDVQLVQPVVDSLSSLLVEKTKTIPEPSHARNKVVFEQMKLRRHIAPFSLHDFSSSCHHEH